VFVELLEQDRAGAGVALGVRGGDDHGVRLEQVRLGGRLLEPARELFDGRGGQVGLGEALRAVLLAHGGGVREDGVCCVGHAVILPYERLLHRWWH
jgi:hypothetical protein